MIGIGRLGLKGPPLAESPPAGPSHLVVIVRWPTNHGEHPRTTVATLGPET